MASETEAPGTRDRILELALELVARSASAFAGVPTDELAGPMPAA